MEVKIISASKEATFELGVLIATCLKGNDIIALEGDLGAGKTKLTSGIAEGLDCEAEIVSPTFTILRDYEKLPGQKLSLYHFDAYRLKNEKEFEAQGFDEYFDKNGVTIIEWADIIRGILPERTINIYFSIEAESESSKSSETVDKSENDNFLLELQDELCDLFSSDLSDDVECVSSVQNAKDVTKADRTNDLFTKSLSSDKEDQRRRVIRIVASSPFISEVRGKLEKLNLETLTIQE